MGDFRAAFERFAAEHPMVGDVRGDGFFYSLELVRDKEAKGTFGPAVRDELIKGFLVPRARELGVYMRVDDRAEVSAQFSPPLVAGPAELEEFLGVLRQVLDEAWERLEDGWLSSA
jgi:adenosylmethionine-8-amino-7-oxononanoate aminotransferase